MYLVTDTEITECDISLMFGGEIANIVNVISGIKQEPMEEYIARLKSKKEAVLVKLAERLYELRLLSKTGSDEARLKRKFRMFLKHYSLLFNHEDEFLQRYKKIWDDEIAKIAEIIWQRKQKML